MARIEAIGLIAAAVLSGAAGRAQTTSSSAPRVLEQDVFVRRFSAGATLSVLGLSTIGNGSARILTASPPVDAMYTTTPASGASQRIGYGATVQIAITEHFAVNASLLARRAGYLRESDIFTGTDNPNTPQDDRVHTTAHEDTRWRMYDVPVVLRLYGKGRRDPGPRWFLEAGGAVRRLSNIRTSIATTVGTAGPTYEFTTATPGRRTLRGMAAGFGVQVIDPVGVRVVPEVRYTRWMGTFFEAPGTVTRRNQVEAMISLTF